MIDELLKSNEKLVQEWHPEFRVFLRKMFVLGAVTTLFLGGVSYSYGVLIWLLSIPIFMLAYVFLFDDYVEWRQRRHDRWLLTNQRLIFLNPDDESGVVSVDLSQVVTIKKWMWWALRIKLGNGQTVMLMFLPQLDDIRTAILSARDQVTGEPDA